MEMQRRSIWQTLNLGGQNRAFYTRLVIFGLFLLPVVAGYTSHLLWQVMDQLTQLKFEDQAAATQIIHELRSVGFLFLSVIILLCLLAIYFVFFLAVRIYGPQVALLRFIEQIKAGNYTPYRSLRRDDQLKEIWQALQELAADLAKKKS